MRRLLLQSSHRRTGHNAKNTRYAVKDNNLLVRIPRDLLAFDVRLRQPPLGKSMQVYLKACYS